MARALSHSHSALDATCWLGVYCAPLRLLALEVFERLNQSGVRCELLTGQEFKAIPGTFRRPPPSPIPTHGPCGCFHNSD